MDDSSIVPRLANIMTGASKISGVYVNPAIPARILREARKASGIGDPAVARDTVIIGIVALDRYYFWPSAESVLVISNRGLHFGDGSSKGFLPLDRIGEARFKHDYVLRRISGPRRYYNIAITIGNVTFKACENAYPSMTQLHELIELIQHSVE